MNAASFLTPPEPPADTLAAFDDLRDRIDQVARERSEAVEWIARHAHCRGVGMIIELDHGAIADAYPARYVPAGECYALDTGTLRRLAGFLGAGALE